MKSIKIEELTESIKDNFIYTIMFGIITILLILLDIFSTNLMILNAIVAISTMVSAVIFIFFVSTLLRDTKELKKAILIQEELENTLNDIIIEDVDLDFLDEPVKNDKKISEILNII